MEKLHSSSFQNQGDWSFFISSSIRLTKGTFFTILLKSNLLLIELKKQKKVFWDTGYVRYDKKVSIAFFLWNLNVYQMPLAIKKTSFQGFSLQTYGNEYMHLVFGNFIQSSGLFEMLIDGFSPQILQRQSMWLHNRRITVAFFNKWKIQVSRHLILVSIYVRCCSLPYVLSHLVQGNKTLI